MTDHAAAASLDEPRPDYAAELTLGASPDAVFQALTMPEGLAAWWTPVTGNGLAGGELTFDFGPGAQAVMRVDAAAADGVHWTNLACHVEDWVGTQVHFELAGAPANGTHLRFRHEGLTPRLECYRDCKSGWDHYLTSLRAYTETGTGNPRLSPADMARRQPQGAESANAR